MLFLDIGASSTSSEWDWFAHGAVQVDSTDGTTISLLEGASQKAVWQKMPVDLTGATKLSFELTSGDSLEEQIFAVVV